MHVSFVLRDEVTNVLDTPDRSDIGLVNQARFAVGGANQEELRFCYQIPGIFCVCTSGMKGWSSFVLFLFDLWVI